MASLKLLKKCLGDSLVNSFPKEFREELIQSIDRKRIDLFPSDFGLNSRGKPDGGFYTFVQDSQKVQQFVQASAEIFFPEEIENIFSRLFPKSCFVKLTLVKTESGGIPPTNIPFVGPHAEILKKEINSNVSALEKIKKCLKSGETARASASVVTIDPGGYVIGSHAIILMITGVKSKIKVTIIDPAAIKTKGQETSLALLPVELELSKLGKVKIITPNFSCKRSFQGQSDLCSVWSLFLLLTQSINPTSWWSEIEKYYLDLSDEESSKIILKFSYWFLETFGDLHYIFPGGKIARTYSDMVEKIQLRHIIKIPKVEW